MPFSQKIFLPVVIGLSLCGASAYLLYLLTKNNDEEENIPRSSAYRRSFQMKIPKDVAPSLIGRGGSNIKGIQEKSGCKISVDANDESDDEDRICVIRGRPDEILVAELLITEFLSGIALIEVEEIWVPKTACNRIIGRCGENIQRITRSSNAKVHVESNITDGSDDFQRKITIKGTPEQISVAKSMIETFVAEDAEIRQNLSQRQPRGPPRISPAPSPVPLRKETSSTSIASSKNEKFIENGSHIDGQIEVYVSAVDDPSKFWVQIVGPKATELDQLVDQMTEYYGKEENALLHELTDISIGEIVAAKFDFDKKWYRAEIKKIRSEEDKSEILELYFVDYGDVGTARKNEVYELRTDFLRLRFQAIECYLANVEPINSKWSEEAIDLFEELTQVAQWKKLWSKVVCYRDQRAGGVGDSKDRRRREGSPVPGIQLYDNTKDGDLNVGDELVKAGFAVYEKDSTSLHGGSSLSSLNNEHVTSKSKHFDSMKLSNDSMDEISNISDVSSISESVDTKNDTISDSVITPNIPTIKLSDVDYQNITPSSSNNEDKNLIFSTPAEKTLDTSIISITSEDDNNFQENGNTTEFSGNGTGDQLLFSTPSRIDTKHTPTPKSTNDFLTNERLTTHEGSGDSHMTSSTPLNIKKNSLMRKIE